jgi:hypothetical protein
MKILIFKENPEGMSSHTVGEIQTRIIDPSLIGTEMMEAEDADFVLIDKKMGHNNKLKAITVGHRITGYKHGNFEKVALV